MLNAHKFDKFCNSVELSQAERALAEKVWLAAESACFGKSPEIARLLSSEKEWVSKDAFSKQELQFMKSVFEKTLVMLGNFKSELKFAAQETWEQCDKSKPETAESFARHKKIRSFQQRLKRQMNTVATIQHKIKSLISK